VTDTNDAVLRVSQSDEGWSIIAHQRVRAIAVGRLPTAEDYRAALVQCLKDKAAEIERLRLTDEERQAIAWLCGDVADITVPPEETLRGLLERTA